jgi:DNA-binding response OmpR family regulator
MNRILVVDDDPVIVELLTAFFELDGLEISQAANGVEAIEVLLAESPDLMILDLMLPQMDGYAVLEAMDADERLTKIPTIILSAKDKPDAQIKAWTGNVRAYVTKPFDPNSLVELVKRTLESPEMTDEAREARIRKLRMIAQADGGG